MVLNQVEDVAMEKVNLFDVSFDFFHLIMIFMRVQIGNHHTGNGSSRQSATGGDNGGGSSSRGGRETSDEEEEEEPAPRPKTKSRTNEGNNKRQRTGIPDQSKEYFGVAMEKIVSAATSSAVSSAINSTGVDRKKDREYEQQRRERAESQLHEFELKQKLSDQRRDVEEEVAVKYKNVQEEAAVKYRELEAKFQEMSLSKVMVIVFFI